MKWLLEPEVFDEDEQPLIDALTKFHIPYIVVESHTPYQEYIKNLGFEKTIFHGSLRFGKIIQEMSLHSVKVHCTLPKYECLYYYPRIGSYLLNSEYVMLPFGELNRRKNWLFDMMKGSLFLRPSSGYKTFNGLVISDSEWDLELRFLKRQVNPEELVVVAPVQKIVKEWRTVIVDNLVITAGQYSSYGENVRIKEVPDQVLHFAQEVIDFVEYTPDRAWTLDVCQTNNGDMKVIEANSFSCAGLYACDYEAVVRAVNLIT